MANVDSQWEELDNAAYANLDEESLDRFFKYKKELKDDAHEWTDDAYDILSGFIWDESEDSYEDDET